MNEPRNTDDFSASEVALAVGDNWERKTERETIYYVLSGYGVLNVETYGYSLGPEMAVYVPRNTAHDITNSGSVALTLVKYAA